MTLTDKIIEVFENYLDKKDITIDNPEREEDPNASKIYGTDYSDMFVAINNVINGTTCDIDAGPLYSFYGELSIKHNGDISVRSEEVEEYIYNNSIE